MQELDTMIQGARRVPLTTQFQVEKDRAYDVLDRMRAESVDSSVVTAIDAFDDAMHNAKPVPLTDNVRMEGSELAALTGNLRAAILRGNRPSPTN